MNSSSASQRRSSSALPATILPFDSTSFITDHPRKWLPQSPSHLAPATPSSKNSFQQDFELFAPVPSTNQSTAHWASRAPATSSTAPNIQTTAHRQSSLNAPYQSAGPSSTSLTQRSYSNPLAQKQLFQASPNPQQPKSRPPVPPFYSHSTGSIHLQTQQTGSQFRTQIPLNTSGRYSISPLAFKRTLTPPSSDMNLFDDPSFVGHQDSFDTPAEMFSDHPDFASSWSAINGSGAAALAATNTGTVSPKDIMNDSIAMSAPSSTAFPPLSTPGSGFLESPYPGTSSLDTSPMNADGSLDADLDFNSYPSLFPDSSNVQYKQNIRVNTSFNSASSGYQASSPAARQAISPGRPSTHARKHSTTSGVRPAKHNKPLPEIVCDPSKDTKEDLKRKKNTAAARKSRLRKLETSDAKDTRIEKLEEENERLIQLVYSLGGSPEL